MKAKRRLLIIWAGVVVFLLFLSAAGFAFAYKDKVFPHVYVGPVAIGGLNRDQAGQALREHIRKFTEKGLALDVNGTNQSISLEAIGFSLDINTTLEAAFAIGRSGSALGQLAERVALLFRKHTVIPEVQFDRAALERQLDEIGFLVNQPKLDVRIQVSGVTVKTFLDTKPGFVMNRQKARQDIGISLYGLANNFITVDFRQDVPHADPASAPQAKKQAEQMIKKAIAFEYDETVTITREQIGSWIISDYQGDKLVPEVNQELVRSYVAKLAGRVNRSAGQPKFSFESGRVAEFVPPRPGRALEESKTVEAILDELHARRDGEDVVSRIIPAVQENSQSVMQLPISITKSAGSIPENLQGITELIGTATTPFTGSPANRISNIKNGVKFITGVVIQPGEEFSTLHTLGIIDNTSGYLPELVIKGDRTLPEFGGGLCQVSTTLFRAVLNAGLPVTSRRNHSYRVSYYEWDGVGQHIGPGLDATIYEPDPDFKFKNDTDTAVLIYGYVTTNKVTFELYGTKDGRISKVIGPKTLTTTPAGDPIYEETSLLAKGVTKQVEKPHPGGSATATYEVTYADGRKAKQEFKSWYRPWPARFLVGTGGEVVATPTPTL